MSNRNQTDSAPSDAAPRAPTPGGSLSNSSGAFSSSKTRTALEKCVAVLSGAEMNKAALIDALTAAGEALREPTSRELSASEATSFDKAFANSPRRVPEGSVHETAAPPQDRAEHLEFVLRGFYWDQVDYIKRNHLGGMDNHWMRATRIALGILPDAPVPAEKAKPTLRDCICVALPNMPNPMCPLHGSVQNGNG